MDAVVLRMGSRRRNALDEGLLAALEQSNFDFS